MALSSILGYPRIGRDRELTHACASFWTGSLAEDALRATSTALRRAHGETQRAAGIALIPVNDVSTRAWDEVTSALTRMVGAARRLRADDEAGGSSTPGTEKP